MGSVVADWAAGARTARIYAPSPAWTAGWWWAASVSWWTWWLTGGTS